MSLCQDRQIKGFLLFLTLFALLFVGTATVLTIYQVNDAEVLWLKHDEAVSSSLLEQGVPKEVIAVAFTNTDISEDGRSLLAAAGLGKQSESSMRPYFNQFQRSAFCTMLCTVLFFLFVLAIGIFIFFWKRKRLYQQADKILLNYINGDYSCHLPQNYEGAIYQVFSSVEQLATMLQSKNETERKAKEFLKDTISDISHQLKTPLAALAMYQEIIESEPENAETVKQFATKMGISLKRMEQLISSMLKITRLDTGNIIFEKKSCRMSELIAHSVNELTARAKNENKQIQIDGDGEQKLICDMSFHHYPNPQAFFDSVKRCLRPNGRLILRDVTSDNKVLVWLMNTLEMPLANICGHGDVQVPTRDVVIKCCKKAGLKVEKFEIRKGMRMHCVVRKA